MGGAGSVAFQFLHAGQILIARESCTEDRLMEVALEAGADDVITSDEGYEVRCPVNSFDRVLQAIDKAGIRTESSEVAYIPTNTVPVTELSVARSILKLQDMLEEYDDVQNVFSNEELDEKLAEAARE